jgi:hypothetical protein
MSFEFGTVIKAWADHVGPRLAQRVATEAPKGSGALKHSISYRRTVTGLQVVSSAHYATYVSYGTGPHPIDPVHARVLHWVDKKSGTEVFAMHVDHPGTRPNPYPQRALIAMKAEITGTLGVLASGHLASGVMGRVKSLGSLLGGH